MKIFGKFAIEDYTKTVGNKNEVDEIMGYVLLTHRIFCQQVLDPSWTWKGYSFHLFICAALNIYVFIGTFVVLRDSDDIKTIAEGGYTYIISIMYITKYAFFVHKRFLFRKLYVELKTTLFEVIKNESEVKLKKVIEQGRKMTHVFYLMAFPPLFVYVMTTVWLYANGNMVTLSKTTSILMPMRTPYYEIGLLLHTYHMSIATFTILVADLWFVFGMYFFCVASDSLLKCLLTEKREKNETKEDYATRLNGNLRKFYTVHVKLIEFLNMLKAMFSWLTLIPLVNVAMCSCLLILLMCKGVDWTFVSNVLPILAELLAYNWFGEQIKNNANDWNMALLDFDWTSLRTKDMKTYHIMVLFMNNKFGIKTITGTDLSLITLSDVLKTSYQIFTVMRTMDG